MNRGVGVAALFGAAFVASALTGCDSDQPSSAVVIVLPDPNTAADLSSDTRAVQLSVGQVVEVQVRQRDRASRWRQVSAGDARVLKPDGKETVTACPADQTGCGPTVRERYRAVSAGTTMIEWDYVGMGPGTLPPGVSTTPCPDYGRTARCPIGIMKISITVR